LTREQIAKHYPKVRNVRLGLKLQTAAIRKVFRELGGTSLAQCRNSNGLLLLHDELVLRRGALGLKSLPWQSALEEIHQDVPDGFEVITAGLLHTQVVVDGGIAGRAGEGPALALGDVLEGAGVAVSLRKAKINAVHKVTSATTVSDEVGWLDVAMDEMTAVHYLHSLQHLIRDHEDSLEAEPTSALVELILKGWTEQIHYHQVI